VRRFLLVFDHQKLKTLRMERGYSLAGLARRLEQRTGLRVTRAGISCWERGKNLPSLTSLIAVAELYGKELGYFFQHK